jgi:hypothetical protein
MRSSYSKTFAFSAYLLRNHGGAELVRRILANNAVDVLSITTALQETNPEMTFEIALRRYGEALVFSGSNVPDDVFTFDRTVTRRINGVSYTASAFNIWNMPRDGGGTGPHIFDLNPRAMRPNSVSLHSTPAWRNMSGSLSITLERPADQNVVLFLMVR